MKKNRYATLKNMAWLITIYIIATTVGFIILFIGIRVLAHLIEGVSVEYNFGVLLKAVKIGIPLGLLGGVGHWVVYKLNIR
ncbi:hypothetical protein [Serratia proteamaculans]